MDNLSGKDLSNREAGRLLQRYLAGHTRDGDMEWRHFQCSSDDGDEREYPGGGNVPAHYARYVSLLTTPHLFVRCFSARVVTMKEYANAKGMMRGCPPSLWLITPGQGFDAGPLTDDLRDAITEHMMPEPDRWPVGDLVRSMAALAATRQRRQEEAAGEDSQGPGFRIAKLIASIAKLIASTGKLTFQAHRPAPCPNETPPAFASSAASTSRTSTPASYVATRR